MTFQQTRYVDHIGPLLGQRLPRIVPAVLDKTCGEGPAGVVTPNNCHAGACQALVCRVQENSMFFTRPPVSGG